MTDPQSLASPTRVFLSYARSDDEPFVKRLHADLMEAGFTVWFDRDSLMSRGLSFHQEIKDAIRTEVDRVVYVGGPKAALSAYVREEWQFALECDRVVVTPILRLGDYVNVPGELSLMHCEDFRDDAKYDTALAKLTASLRLPNPKLGALFAVPNLPPNFLGRPELMRRVRDALLVDLQKPQVITGADAHVGMQGMGGIGKSVLAAALARNRQAREAYPDGVAWIACGQKLADDDLLRRQRDLVRHLGGDDTFASLAQGQGVLRQLLAAKAVLLVLDDVWRAADAQAFDVLGPRCRMLVTTRDKGILDTLHGELVPVSLFTEQEALQLLADAVNVAVPDLPAEAREVGRECGFLPLALALCGGMAKSGHAWSEIVEALREADLEWPENREAVEQHRTIWNAMKASYDALPDQEKPRFAELAVFVTDQTVPEAAAATLWEHTGEVSTRNASKLLINLAERSLVQLDQQTAADGKVRRHFRLHDLLCDFAARVAGDPRAVQRELLNAYRMKCPDGWPSGPNDGYFLQNLVAHILAAGLLDDAVTLLTDLPWVEAKCRVGLVFDLMRDYREVSTALPEAQEELEAGLIRQETAARYAAELVAYASAWSAIQSSPEAAREAVARRTAVGRGNGAEAWPGAPALPVPPPTCRMWTDEEIQADCDRIIGSPTRADRLDSFTRFVSSQCYPLLEFGDRPGFVRQHGFNWEPAGPVRDAAAELMPVADAPWIERMWQPGARRNPSQAEIRKLEGHGNNVYCVSVTPDGHLAVSGSCDYTLRVWDVETGMCLGTLSGHSGRVTCVSVTPDGRRAISGSEDKTLRVWDLENGSCLRTIDGHTGWVLSVSVTPDGSCAVSSCEDSAPRIWDLKTGACMRTLKGHRWGVRSVSVTPDGLRAVSGSSDGTLCVWDVKSGACLRTLEGHSNEVFSVSVTPDGRRAISGSYDTTLRVWDLERGACLHILEGHVGVVRSVSVSPDGRRAISGGSDKTLRIWDLESGVCLRNIVSRSGDIYSVSLVADARCAVSGSADSAVRIWDLESGACPPVLDGHSEWVWDVSVSADGRRAVSGSDDETLRVWDLESGACLRIIEGDRDKIRSVSMTQDGRSAVSGGWGSDLCIWDLENGVCRRKIWGELGWFRDVSVTSNGRRAVSGGDDRMLRVWDLEECTCLGTLSGHGDRVTCVGVMPDGRRAISGSADKTLRVWDLESGACLRILEGHTATVRSVGVTPDGRRAISGSADKTLRVWDLESGACLRILEGHTEVIRSVSVVPDGHRAISGSADKTLRVWDLDGCACLGVYRASEEVFAAAPFGCGGGVCLAVGEEIQVVVIRGVN